MDNQTLLTNDEIMFQEKLRLISLRKTIYSYLNDYISTTKLEGKLNVIDIHLNKNYDKMLSVFIATMIEFDNSEDKELAKDLTDYILKVDHNSFSDFINNINY